jgi:hypothetical protein
MFKFFSCWNHTGNDDGDIYSVYLVKDADAAKF